MDEWENKAFCALFEVLEEISSDIRRGVLMLTNIVPFKGVWFLSGAQHHLDTDEKTIFHKYIKNQVTPAIYRNNKEKLKLGFELQKKEYKKFIEYFGCNEIITSGKELQGMLREYYKHQDETGKYKENSSTFHSYKSGRRF